MELVYLWIENYKNIIIDEGFNFGSENIYRYENNILYKEKNKNYRKYFFGKSIVNITGIIGKNGSGKSTLLNFIKENLTNDLKMIKEQAIVILRVKGKDVVFKHKKIKIENFKEFDIKVYCFEDTRQSNNLEEELNTSIIYFSNVFDTNYNEVHLKSDLIDISTNHLVRYDKYTNEDETENTNIGEVQAYEILELYRQMLFNFHYSKKNKFVDFLIPNEIEIMPMEVDYLNYLEVDDIFDIYENKDDINESLDNKIKSESNSDSEDQNFKCKVGILLIENIIRVSSEYYKNDFEKIKTYISKELYIIATSSPKMIEKLSDFFENMIRYIKKDKLNTDYLEVVICSSKNIYNFISNRKKDEFHKGKLILKDEKQIAFFLDEYYLILLNVQLLNFKWRSLSSGQTAMLNLFSRLYWSIDRGIVKRNLLLLIDEGEIYFHPQWQRRIIKYLADFLPTLYGEENINVQIVITSNSPFIISDLPSSNIVFMENTDDKEVSCSVINNRSIKIETFASNIHNLFSNSFFMESTIGEFANQKIKTVVKDLNEKSKEEIISIDGRKEEIRYIIKNIGEPVIKRKLEEMYRTIFPKDRKDYELQIIKLQREKAELEKSLKDKDIDKIEYVMKLLDMKIRALKKKAGDMI